MSDTALEHILVTEIGSRIGVGVCGSLLRQLGATVVMVEAPQADDAPVRRQLAAGKRSFVPNGADDAALLERLLEASDVIVASSDVDEQTRAQLARHAAAGRAVVCDITAYGSTGTLAGTPHSDLQVQAFSGIADTTGLPDGPPVPIGVPIVEFMTGAYAAGATVAALRVKRQSGVGQKIDMALYDCAFASLFTFMGGLLMGERTPRSRLGNRHPSVAPWNLFKAADGMVLICAGNQPQWQRLCKIIGRPDLDNEKTNSQAGRMANIKEIDAAIEAWTSTLTGVDSVQKMSDATIPSGPIAPIDHYPREANLDFRKMIHRLADPVTGRDIYVPASPMRLNASPALLPESIPARDEGRAEVKRIVAAQKPATAAAPAAKPKLPLAGIRIVEIGQYTTAPLTARQLAHLGADVIKIEPPGGADGRTWLPVLDGISVGFRGHNASKRSLVLDLKSAYGREVLGALIESADVLLENLKPGTLDKLGFSPEGIAKRNPRIVYCGISGFGADSLYANRPAFDMIIQAMSGFMDAVGPDNTPLKSGISTSDLMGAEIAIASIIAALEYRDRTGKGQHVDLSMQDITAWVSQAAWNLPAGVKNVRNCVFACADGYVAVDGAPNDAEKALTQAGKSAASLATLDRQAAADLLNGLGLRAAAVLGVHEAVVHPQTDTRRLWFLAPAYGREWPVFASPLRLTGTVPEPARPGPNIDEGGDSVLAEIKMPRPAAEPAA